MSAKLWSAGGASVLGASHKRRGLPNQDAWFAEPSGRSAEQFLVSVADGHGGALHHRSDRGAQLAVSALRDALNWFFDDPSSLPELPTDLHTIWLNAVNEDLHNDPCEEGVVAYGTTAVAVAGNANHMLAIQLGDGDLVLGYADGRLERPFAEDELVGEETYSLCMPNAAKYVKQRLFSRSNGDEWPEFAFVSTDGVSKSFVDSTAFDQVVASYRELVADENTLTSTIDALPGWLRDVSDNGSGDDATLCIAARL